MKNKRIFYYLLFSVFLLISGCFNAYAESTSITLEGTIPYSYRVRDMYGNITTINYGRYIYANNEIAFCVQPGVLVDESASYEASLFSHAQKTKMERIAYAGWHASSQTVEDYLATQFYIWEVLGATIEDTSLSDYPIRKAEIEQRVRLLFEQKPSFANTTHDIAATKSITLTDNNEIFSYYTLKSKSSGVRVEQNGNQLKIAASNSTADNASVTFQLVKDEYQGTSMVYQSTSSQSVVPFKVEVNRSFVVHLNVKRANLKILKSDQLGVPLSDVSFMIAKDENFQDVLGTYQTNSEGIILVENINPGIYYAKEVDANDHLILSDDIHKINVEAGKTTQYRIKNDYRKIIIEKQDTKGNLIPDVTFEIGTNSSMSEILGTYTTNNEGIVEIEDKWNYRYIYIREKSVPPHLILNNTVYRVKLNEHQDTKYIAINEYAYQPVHILKTDYDGNPIANVSFKLSRKSDMSEYVYFDDNMIERNDGAGKSTLTTNANGKVSVYVKPGIYYIQECLAPDHIIIDPSIKRIVVEEGNVVKFSMYNDYREIIIEKQDEAGNKVANVTFEIGTSSSMEKILGTYTTESNGRIKIDDIWNYSYIYIREKSVPNHLALNDTVYRVKLNKHDHTYYVAVNEFRSEPMYIKKTDEDGKPVANVSFKISRKSDMSEYIYFDDNMYERVDGKGFSTITTSDNGYCKVFLKPGTYYVQEVLVPEGYLLNNTIQSIQVAYNETNIVHFENKYTQLHIIKEDENQQRLKDVSFEISQKKDFSTLLKFDENGVLSDTGSTTVTTNDNGKIILKKLVSGIYYIREVKANDNLYFSINDIYEIDLRKNQNRAITIQNRERELKIVKKNVVEEVLEGAVFIISRNEDMSQPLCFYENKESATGDSYLTTNEKGEIVLKGLSNGIYYIQEIQAPLNYILDQRILKIELVSNQDYQLELYNEAIEIVIHKTNEQNEAIEGVHFEISSKKDFNEIICEGITNEQGYLRFEGLNSGTYYVRESETLNQYILDSTIHEVHLSNQQVKLDIKNHHRKVYIYKYDEESQGIKDVHFGIYRDEKCQELLEEVITNKEGIASFNGIYDTYYIKELDAPTIYLLNDKIEEVKLNPHQDGEVIFTNQKHTLTIVKKDDNGQLRSDVVFKIYEDKDCTKCIYEGKTNAQGIIQIPVAFDIVYVKEIATNDDLILDTTIQQVQLKAHQNMVIERINERKWGSILIQKKDEQQRPLANVTFAIASDAQMKHIIAYQKSDQNGKVFFEKLLLGTYYIQECDALEGYVKDDTIYQIEIKEAKKIEVLDCINIPFLFSIVKVKEDGTPLAGAQFVILNQDGEEVVRFISGQKPFIANMLENNESYILRELKAPVGYIKMDDVSFVAKHNDVLMVTNEAISYQLQIQKVDDVSKELILSHCIFGIYTDEDCMNCIQQIESDSGIFTFSNLQVGTYYVKEIKAPSGYALDPSITKVTFDDETQVMITIDNHKVIPETGVHQDILSYYSLMKWLAYGLLSISMMILLMRRYRYE